MRHAEPDWMPEGRHRSDPELTERGQVQAMRLAERVADWPRIDEIWVSPALRAQQTAAPVIEQTGVPTRTFDWLLEARPIDLEGLTRQEIRERLTGVRGRSLDEWWAGLADGEDLRAFDQRVTKGWDEALGELAATRQPGPPHYTDLPSRRVLVVSHAGTSGTSVGHLLGLPPVPWSWERFRLGHTGCAVLRSRRMSTGEIFSLDRFNDREHLPRALYTN